MQVRFAYRRRFFVPQNDKAQNDKKLLIFLYLNVRQYNFFVYIITNYSKKVLYTGVTNDLNRRLYEHYFGNGKKNSFTTRYKCHYLVWYERHKYIDHAIERETEIKGWLRNKKVELIEQENPNWLFLNKDIMEWPPVWVE